KLSFFSAMKYLKVVSCILVLGVLVGACNDDFLTRTPMDRVSDKDYFKAPSDLKTYVNQFYNNGSFPIYTNFGNDYDSDNQISDNLNTRLEGTRVLSSGGGISYSKVRKVNYFFDHYKKVEKNASFDEYKQYLGEAHFFRALTYFSLLRSYGDVLWLEATVTPDSPELYQSRDSRN